MTGNYAACSRAASPGLESMLVDAQAGNSCVKRLAWDSQLFGCAVRARDSALALRQRGFDHLFLTLDERRDKRNDLVRYRSGSSLQPCLINRECFPIAKDNGSLDDIL